MIYFKFFVSTPFPKELNTRKWYDCLTVLTSRPRGASKVFLIAISKVTYHFKMRQFQISKKQKKFCKETKIITFSVVLSNLVYQQCDNT